MHNKQAGRRPARYWTTHHPKNRFIEHMRYFEIVKLDVMQALNYAFRKGFQVHPDVVRLLEEVDVAELDKVFKDIIRGKFVDRDYHISRSDLVEYLQLDEVVPIKNDHNILFDCTTKITTPGAVAGYTALFQSRFRKMRRIMETRSEFKKVRRISTVKTRVGDGGDVNQKTEDVYVCGLITKKRVDETSSRLTIEDDTGELEGVVYHENVEVVEKLFMDQFVMVKVELRRSVVFSDIVLPDALQHKPNRSDSEAVVAFLSDLHVGSNYFLEREFEDFVSWVSGPEPEARNLRFVLIAGDIVDGVGIFPRQERELVQQTIHEQLEKARELLERIPRHIKIFISPGNHDPGRRALPQPAIPIEDAAGLWGMDNVYMLSNPCMVSLNDVEILMFHGQSIDDIVQTTGQMEYDKPVPIMKQMLRCRHLSPIYGNRTPIAPDMEDYMVIDRIPDVLHTGHVHVTGIGQYKNTLVVNSGTWQGQTPFQVSVGQTPTPGSVVLLNLKTFKVVVRRFVEDDRFVY